MNTQAEIEQCFRDYQSKTNGFESYSTYMKNLAKDKNNNDKAKVSSNNNNNNNKQSATTASKSKT